MCCPTSFLHVSNEQEKLLSPQGLCLHLSLPLPVHIQDTGFAVHVQYRKKEKNIRSVPRISLKNYGTEIVKRSGQGIQHFKCTHLQEHSCFDECKKVKNGDLGF